MEIKTRWRASISELTGLWKKPFLHIITHTHTHAIHNFKHCLVLILILNLVLNPFLHTHTHIYFVPNAETECKKVFCLLNETRTSFPLFFVCIFMLTCSLSSIRVRGEKEMQIRDKMNSDTPKHPQTFAFE